MAKYRSVETIDAVPYEEGMEAGFIYKCDTMGQCLAEFERNGTLLNCVYCTKGGNIKKIPYLLKAELPVRRVLIRDGDYIVTDEDGWKTSIPKEVLDSDYTKED